MPLSDARGTAVFLQGLEVLAGRVEDWAEHPFRLPFVRHLRAEFAPITFIIGENGSGKTTLVEAIAEFSRLPIGGGGRNELADDARTGKAHSPLAKALRPRFRQRPPDGYFVRAENLVRLADLLEQRERDPEFRGDPYGAYGGRSLHERSHGEAFLALFEHRLRPGGMLIMDEPEAALSPHGQLSLLAQLHAFLASGATQVIIATHSPILMTFPGAKLLEIRTEGLVEARLEDTSHYQITRGILEHPERYWKHLRGT